MIDGDVAMGPLTKELKTWINSEPAALIFFWPRSMSWDGGQVEYSYSISN